MAGLTIHQTRRALALIDDADRCSDSCPGWVVSLSDEYGLQIERCDECNGTGAVRDDDVQQLPEAQAMLRDHASFLARLVPVANRPELEIQTILVASTAHVREDTAKRIDADIEAHPETTATGSEAWSPQLSWEYGWIWHVREIDAKEAAQDEWPPELAALLNFAHEQGVTWLRLDCDADTISGLPTWDW